MNGVDTNKSLSFLPMQKQFILFAILTFFYKSGYEIFEIFYGVCIIGQEARVAIDY